MGNFFVRFILVYIGANAVPTMNIPNFLKLGDTLKK